MSNLYLSQVLYNHELKDRFLNEYQQDENKKTNVFYKYIFQIAYNTETKLDKDIYDFNDSELRLLINSYKNGSLAAVQSVVSVLKKYLDYCVGKGYIRVNLLQDISGYDDYIQFVDKTVQAQKYISHEQFEQMILDCLNYQDAYPIAMAYYGFKGEGNCEIINLKISDVNEVEGTIYIESRDKTYKVDQYLMDIIIGTIKEDEYKKLLVAESIKTDVCRIHPNDYVMRVVGKQINEPVKAINVTSRLNRVKTYSGNAYLTITSIWYSGMLDMARSLYAEKGVLEKEDWIAIGERYGYDAVYWSKNKQRFEGLLDEKKD